MMQFENLSYIIARYRQNCEQKVTEQNQAEHAKMKCLSAPKIFCFLIAKISWNQYHLIVQVRREKTTDCASVNHVSSADDADAKPRLLVDTLHCLLRNT